MSTVPSPAPILRLPASQRGSSTVAVAVAVRGPDRVTVAYLMAVMSPGTAMSYVVVNLGRFTFDERLNALRQLGQELASRWPGQRHRLFVGRADVPYRQARACLKGLSIEVERGYPYNTTRVNATKPVGVLSQSDTVVLPSPILTVATDGSINPITESRQQGSSPTPDSITPANSGASPTGSLRPRQRGSAWHLRLSRRTTCWC